MSSLASSYKREFTFNVEEFLRKSQFVNLNCNYDDETTKIDDGESSCESSCTDSRKLEDDEDDEDSDKLNEIYLALYWMNNSLAASYYDSNKQIIYFLNDIQETRKFEVISLLLLDLKPTCVITTAKSDETLINYLKENVDDKKLLFLPNNDFNYELAKKRILQLRLEHVVKLNLNDDNERFIYFSSFLNFESNFMIRSLGALLKYLDKNRINVQLEEKSITTPILAFKSIQLDDVLFIDENSLKALQVFYSVNHPSAYKQNTNKEGLSLFNLFLKKTQTKMGSAKLRSWFLKPTRDQTVLRRRHEVIDFFMDSRNQDFTQRITSLIRNCKNVSLVFKRLKVSQPNVSDWMSLYKTTENLIKLITICDQLVNNNSSQSATDTRISSFTVTRSVVTTTSSNLSPDNLFEKLVVENNENFDNLNRIFNVLVRVVDFKKMTELKKFTVLSNIDDNLDYKRDLYANLSEYLSQVGKTELEKINLQSCTIIYIPQIGFLLVVSNKHDLSSNNDRAQFEFKNELTFVFSNDENFYYKNNLMLCLDKKFGDLANDINDIERKVMFDLQLAISEYSYVYSQLTDLCSEIDVCLAYSIVAREHDYVKPVFDRDRTSFIYATKSRHPLLELVVNPFVPNDIYSGLVPPKMDQSMPLIDETSTVKILTGPNSSGKSIYMKQVALLIYMSYIGSFVPAKYAFIGDFDRICTRLNSNDSVSLGLSTFSIDIKQISEAINNYTHKSLILIDEFGKGTTSNDGQALLAALIRHILKEPSYLPHVYISTHFYEILNKNLFQINNRQNPIDYLTFDYICEKNDNTGQLEIVHLYTLKRNEISNSSYAINIAEKVGIDSRVISRANEILNFQRKTKSFSSLHTEYTISHFNDCKNAVKEFLELCNQDDESGHVDERAVKFREFLKSTNEFDETKHTSCANNTTLAAAAAEVDTPIEVDQEIDGGDSKMKNETEKYISLEKLNSN